MIDSHCHLADPQFYSDLDAVIARAVVAGVDRMVCIGDTIEESKRGVELAEKHEQIFCTIGVHPHHSSLVEKTDPDFANPLRQGYAGQETVPGRSQFSARDDSWLNRLAELVRSSGKVRAIGETGLDYHCDFSPRGVQREAFRKQLLLAQKLNMPTVVHCREAVEDVWKLVEEIRNAIRHCPLDQLMIETDAPFLAPVPHRGQRNEPAFVVDVAKCVAEIKEMSLKEVDEATTKNAVKFFGLPEQGEAKSLP